MRRLSMLLVVGLVAGLLTSCEVPTAMVVNATVDAPDADPGDGLCETATAGQCTLRAAIQEANALGTPVVVDLQAVATYWLLLTGPGDDVGATGDLDVLGNITIRGHGATISGRNDRVFDNWGTLRLEDLTIQNGYLASAEGEAPSGVGLRNQGTAALVGVTLTYNTSIGGGTTVHQLSGGLTVLDSAIVGNDNSGAGAAGLAVDSGTLVMVGSVVYRNLAGNGESPPQVRQTGGDLVTVDSIIGGGILSTQVCIGFPPRCIPFTFSGDGIVQTAGSFTALRTSIVDNDSGVSPGGTVTLRGTVVANNFEDCVGPVTSGGYNLDEDGTCLDGLDPTDEPSTASLLATIVPPNYAVVPPATSPLLDAIPDGTALLCDDQHPVDQRGEPRPSGAACDIGAIERQPTDP